MIAEIYVYIYGCSIRRINQMNYQDKLKLLEQSLQTDLELIESFSGVLTSGEYCKWYKEQVNLEEFKETSLL